MVGEWVGLFRSLAGGSASRPDSTHRRDEPYSLRGLVQGSVGNDVSESRGTLDDPQNHGDSDGAGRPFGPHTPLSGVCVVSDKELEQASPGRLEEAHPDPKRRHGVHLLPEQLQFVVVPSRPGVRRCHCPVKVV